MLILFVFIFKINKIITLILFWSVEIINPNNNNKCELGWIFFTLFIYLFIFTIAVIKPSSGPSILK